MNGSDSARSVFVLRRLRHRDAAVERCARHDIGARIGQSRKHAAISRDRPRGLLSKGVILRKRVSRGDSRSRMIRLSKLSRTDPTVTTDTLRRSVIDALEELKAKDVIEIDVQGKTSIADLLVIASGTSARHVKSIADEVVQFAKKAGVVPLGVEGESEAEWVLVDLGDVIVHVMLPRIREFYGLERLWTVGDAPREGTTEAGAARIG